MDVGKAKAQFMELGTKIHSLICEYPPFIAIMALENLTGCLLASQGDENLNILLDECCVNIRQEAEMYSKYLKENPCEHGDEEDEG